MRTIDIGEAQQDLARLVERVAAGEGVIITRDGKKLVKIVPLDAPKPIAKERFDFLADQIKVPDDFDTMGAEEIEKMFYGDK